MTNAGIRPNSRITPHCIAAVLHRDEWVWDVPGSCVHVAEEMLCTSMLHYANGHRMHHNACNVALMSCLLVAVCQV